MLTSYKEFNIAKRALSNGALGYVLKNAIPEEIITGIEMVNKGLLFLSEEIDILLKHKKESEITWFSPREKEILSYIAQGYTTDEIAKKIFRDRETVRTFRKNLLIKLNARNSAEMITKGYEQNLVRI